MEAFRTLGNKEARAEYKRLKAAEKLYMNAIESSGYNRLADEITEEIVKRGEEHREKRKAQWALNLDQYKSANVNSDILSVIEKIENNNFDANEKIALGFVSDSTSDEIQNITGIDVRGFKISIEARQLRHILKDHGRDGVTDRSMTNPNDIAKMEYAIQNYDDIRPAGQTRAYTNMVNGKNRLAETVLYEKKIGEKSYYVVQAVPNTKAKTLYIVTAFIGKQGYKKEASQLIDDKNLDVTSENGSANTSNQNISQDSENVNSKSEFSLDYKPTPSKSRQLQESPPRQNAKSFLQKKKTTTSNENDFVVFLFIHLTKMF